MTRAREHMAAALAGMKPDAYGKKTFYTHVTHVSKSGMSRRIKVHAVVNGELESLTWAIARVTESPMDDRGVRIDGCGMNMCSALVDNALHCVGVTDWQKLYRLEDM